MMWLMNLNESGEEPGAVVGPGRVGQGLLLLYVGRGIVLGLGLDMLRRVLAALW